MTYAIAATRLFDSTTDARASTLSNDVLSGFSISRLTPRSASSLAMGICRLAGVQMTAPSNSSFSASSKDAYEDVNGYAAETRSRTASLSSHKETSARCVFRKQRT